MPAGQGVASRQPVTPENTPRNAQVPSRLVQQIAQQQAGRARYRRDGERICVVGLLGRTETEARVIPSPRASARRPDPTQRIVFLPRGRPHTARCNKAPRKVPRGPLQGKNAWRLCTTHHTPRSNCGRGSTTTKGSGECQLCRSETGCTVLSEAGNLKCRLRERTRYSGQRAGHQRSPSNSPQLHLASVAPSE